MILGIDPGAPPKTAFAWRDPELGWQTSLVPPAGVFLVAAAEKPAGVIREKRTPASVVSPAFWGGAALFSVQAELRVWLPVEMWKRKLLGSAWNMKKEAACENIREMLRLPADWSLDQLDACGVAHAASLMTAKELKGFTVRWKK